MKNLHPKRFALVLFGVFALSFVVVAMWSGKTIDDLWSALAIAYRTIPIMLGAVAIFVTQAWRWRIFRGWLVPFPDLNGTWQGTIQTTWSDPQTGAIPGPIPAVLTIKQSFIRLSCVMRTAEMTSRSCFADFWLDGDEQIKMLGYSYHSTPIPSVVDRSAPHDGTVVLEIVGSPAKKLKGQYWTSRKTTGEVRMEFKKEELSEEFPGRLGPHPVSGRTQ
jgi:hypothetical protein